VDTLTKSWLRNTGDERAVHNGCRFDVLRGAWTVFWIERYCKLYEGEGYAGNPVILHGCLDCDHSDFHAVSNWDEDGQELHIERARLFAECVANGHHIDWQYEGFMRLFGWVKPSEKWKRDVRRFKQACFWTAKKNKKSPSLAALGMYMLAGDGEPGQKVYLGAKDGDQAKKNAAKHTIEMWRQSDELMSEITLNMTTTTLTHEPSRSVMYPLSSSNSRTQKSKEGLNGSVLIDETHVVDRDFINIISRAGISRSEALFCEFSTAGNNPDGYGKERFDYCIDVLADKRQDEELLALAYAAPQDVSDDQLDQDFEKYARAANPAYGHTIDPIEIRTDYERSKVSLESLGLFKMYRLNIWQHSSNPWLRPSAWAACAAKYSEEDLLGQSCVGGLDLALKWDMSAISLLFANGEKNEQPCYRMLTYLFIPEVTARAMPDIPWKTWADAGYLTLTSGDTTDFPLIRRKINELAKKFELVQLGFDPKFAESFVQQLQDEDGIKVVEVPQSAAVLMEPLQQFESDVVGGRLEHPNNECLNWMAGNATLGRNGMLHKPDGKAGSKKIDGIVAGVMARAQVHELQSGSIYDRQGIMSVAAEEPQRAWWQTNEDDDE
jgi:phage terminase large subunit-like protein